jgi:putative ABC transport system substrate-binding protein
MQLDQMKRREFITLIGGAATVWPVVGRTQQRTTLPQIGILDPGLPQHFESFRRGMDDLGYVEGRSVSYIYRSAAGRAESIPRLASELARRRPRYSRICVLQLAQGETRGAGGKVPPPDDV